MKPTRCAALLAAGLLVSGSGSCHFSSVGGNFAGTASGAAAGAGIAGLFVAGVAYCMVETEDCFPDQEALRAARVVAAKADADFLAGLHRYLAGDPAGLDLICAAARQGDPRAQLVYGSELMKRAPARQGEALFWLRRSAAQGNDQADLLLRRNAALVPDQRLATGAPQGADLPPVACAVPDDLPVDG